MLYPINQTLSHLSQAFSNVKFVLAVSFFLIYINFVLSVFTLSLDIDPYTSNIFKDATREPSSIIVVSSVNCESLNSVLPTFMPHRLIVFQH